jgi:class 3 adenylate cyclase
MLRPLQLLTATAGRVAQGDLDVAVPAPRRRDEVGRLARAFQDMVEGLRQRDFIRNTFGRYVSAEVAEAILGSPGGQRLGGDRREITLLVADLRGFSVLAERLRPEEVIGCLNRHFGRMVEILAGHRATIDEFQGDGILAFFGAPLAAADDPQRAVACALEMQRALGDLNDEERGEGFPELSMGIGIHTGEVIVGNIGSERRTKYGAVGAAVNLAYRIESQTVGGQVLISSTTYARVRDVVEVGAFIEARLKGVSGTVTLHDVLAMRGPYAASLRPRPSLSFVALQPPLPVVCHAVEGAQVVEGGIAGLITRASHEALEMRLERPVELRSSLLVVFGGTGLEEGGEAYGKVVAIGPAENGGVLIALALTAMPPDVRRLLEERMVEHACGAGTIQRAVHADDRHGEGDGPQWSAAPSGESRAPRR